MNNESCIQTIELLRRLALNIHGVIDVIDNRNCNDIINLLKEQEPISPSCDMDGRYLVCGNCGKKIGKSTNYCTKCGRAVKWE